MNEDLMQLMALVKNDPAYFARLEELKNKQLELAHVMEIASTVKEADMYLANARQQAVEIRKEAQKKAEEIKASADALVVEQKNLVAKTKERKATLDKREVDLAIHAKAVQEKEVELEKAIAEHRQLTQARTEEMEKAQKVRLDFETKLRKLKEIANQ